MSCVIDRIPAPPNRLQIALNHPPIALHPLNQEMSDKIDK